MNPILQETAEEELAHALDIPWAGLAKLIPWGDTYTGVAKDGKEAMFERRYLWAEAEGGDILVEVIVFGSDVSYDQGGRASAVIPKG